MSNRDINVLKNNLNSNRIEITDTISQFMEKCNNNFALIGEWGGGPEGSQGDRGEQGVPTKPKVPIHVWKEGKGEEFQYEDEVSTPDGGFEIPNYFEDLRDVKYQEGHLIILENAHVYILENDGGDSLRPKFLLALHSYDPADVINGKNAYVHIAYANTSDGKDGFVTDDELRGESNIPESVSTYGLRRNTPSTYNNTNVIDMPYMGIYSNDKQTSASNPDRYTWVRIQGSAGSTGLQGEKGDKGDKGDKGEKGDKGDNFTGQSYTIDLDGDISTISLSVDRTRLYNDDYCKCTLHSYYGQNNSKLTLKDVTINAPYGYVLNGNVVIDESTSTPIGAITMTQSGNDVDIKFTPENTFVFPETSIVFPINVHTSLQDTNDKKTYAFNRDTIWTIKGIVSSFELEIIPKYRTIKLFENGEYFPENLLVDVYKTINGKRELFKFNDNPSFKLLYKKYDENKWVPYETTGINVAEASTSCLEFKVVKNYGSTNTEEPEEIWDYEDVWVVADGKNTHYYHADLGNTESIMILSTGEKFNIGTEAEPKYCAELRNKNGYSITFDPKFYDGANELTITDVSIGSNSGEIYYNNGTFVRNLTSETIEGVTKYVFTVTQVPYDIETIPMTFNVTGKCPVYDKDGNIEEYIDCVDSIAFNVYISTITNTYTLVPTVSAFNTSTIGSNNTIGCDVYKNNIHIPISKLEKNGLVLKYVVYSSDTDNKEPLNYTEPLVYGDDNDENKFTANDVAIVFLLEYDNKEIVRSTVPLIKDGQNGKDGKDGQNGKDGKDGETPSCIKTTIEGYSTTELPVNSTEWKTTLDELGTLSAGQQIYILNEYTWDNDTTSRGITVTLAGTQGADGKSRVLFYLGSFDNRNGKTPTLEGDSVEGHLTDERCDYYIDRNGNAWMRTGVEDKDSVGVTGNANGNTGNANWKESEKVGFLQANAITADMINAGSITAESAIVSKLFSEEIATNKINALNIVATDISAEVISGKTIQSSNTINPSWTLNNGGDGWLANKNISWTEDGDITIKGSFRQIPEDKTLNEVVWGWDGEETITKINIGEYSDICMAISCSSGNEGNEQTSPDGMGYIDYTNGLSYEWQEPYLICDSSQIGRKIVLSNYRNSTGYTKKPIEFKLDDNIENIYFFENGTKSNYLVVGVNEIVELLGFGYGTTFIGWVVTKRTFLDYESCSLSPHGMQYGLRPSILTINDDFKGYGETKSTYIYLHPWLHTIIFTNTKQSTFTMRLPYNYDEATDKEDAKGNLVDGLHKGQEFEIWKTVSSKLIVELKRISNTDNANSKIISLMNGTNKSYDSQIEITSIGKHKFVWDGYNWYHCRSY